MFKKIKGEFLSDLSRWKILILAGAFGLAAFSRTVPAWASEGGSAGQSLYDALRAIYGSSSSSSGSSNSGSSSGSNSSANSGSSSTGSNSSSSSVQNGQITTDQLMQRMETAVKGPVVQDTELSELYHEDYRVYEETLNENYTIFANVRNGGITNRPVTIDIPKGVGISLKRDGEEVRFASNDVLEKEGSYVLTLYVVNTEEDFTSFSNQTVSRAKFRFRIQYGKGVHGHLGSEVEEEETTTEPVSTVSASDLPEDMIPDDYVYDESDFEPEEIPVEEVSADEIPLPDIEEPDNKTVNSLFESEYNKETGYYKNTLHTGQDFYTNVPNGMLTNETVMIQNNEELIFKLYRNGEEIPDFSVEDYVQEEGNYALVIDSEDPDFQAEYRRDKPTFYFRIMPSAVNDALMLSAPQGATFRMVRFNGVEVDYPVFVNDETVHWREDGDYEITFDDAAGSHAVSFALDTQESVPAVVEEPNRATITYFGGQPVRCVLYRGNELISDPTIVTEVTRPGDYVLYTYDEAGNIGSIKFKVKYRINLAAIISILGVLIIVGGISYYMIRIRKKVKVV